MSESDASPPAGPRRVHLGAHATITSRSRIYLGQEGFEIDEHTGFASGQRTRVLFDEVQLVTLDRRRSKPGLWIAAAGLVFVAFICAIAFASDSQKVHSGAELAGIVAAIALVASPFWLYMLIHLIWGADYVTVFGKRSTARMSFNFRKARAREVFQQCRDEVARHTKSASPAMASETRAPGLPIA